VTIFAIDPGPTQSGWCLLDDSGVADSGTTDNHVLLARVKETNVTTLAIEMVASYGMAVGASVFETVRWIGRFQQAWRNPEAVQLAYRKDIKMHLCHSMRAKDANIRQALLDRFPATGGGKTPQIGTKSKPGPLYGVSGHAWSALAVAIYVNDMEAT